MTKIGIKGFGRIGRIAFRIAAANENVEVVGGARSRAFEVMKASNVFCCCFYKSQDGNEKIWSKSNV